MRDEQIIGLYWDRDEDAIVQTDRVYGQRLHSLSLRIVENDPDAQECVSDTYLRTWDSVPPNRPVSLFAYLAKICRNCSLGRLDWNRAQKRSAQVVTLTRELEQCIPDNCLERELDRRELTRLLDRFLASLPGESRTVFLRRYWHAQSIADISREMGITESKTKTSLHRTRKKLAQYLEKEGIML